MNKFLFPLTAVALCFTAHQAMAATATGQGNAKAKIISAITIANPTGFELNFGTMAAGANAVKIAVDGTRSGGGDFLIEDDNTPQAATIQLQHQADVANREVTISSIPNTTIKRDGGNETIPVTALTPSSNKITLTSAAHDDFTVGGTLGDTTGKPGGDYKGTFDVTISY